MDDAEDVALTFGDPSIAEKKKFRHPIASVFHILFRGTALIFYFISSLFTSGFVTGFIIVVLLSSFDFWVVKNVTGRLLVGLRWWNYIDEDGHSKWIFESRKRKSDSTTKTVAIESRLFWLSLICFPLIWVFLLIVSLLTFKWNASLLTILVALTLTSSNLVGYVKCKKDAGMQVKTMAGSFLGRQIFKQMLRSSEPQSSQTAT